MNKRSNGVSSAFLAPKVIYPERLFTVTAQKPASLTISPTADRIVKDADF